MSPDTLSHYRNVLSKLHRNATKAKGAAPHKPILLLAILHEIDAGRIRQNLVPLTAELVATFQAYWQALVPADAGWNPRMNYPFRYLKHDGFWEIIKNEEPVAIQTQYEPTLSQLASLCDGGRFSNDLWLLLASSHSREILGQHLLTTYFAGLSPSISNTAADDYLTAQAEKLRQQAQAKFKLHSTIKEQNTDGYFVRTQLFPRVIKELYGFACCVCHASVSLGNSSLIDGAHILPFSEFHNDDPRNGLALCKNHHWGFDRGAWSLTDGYEILVSPKLINDFLYVEKGKSIALPKDSRSLPDPLALQWHRETTFKAI